MPAAASEPLIISGIGASFDELQHLMNRADAFARATELCYEGVLWNSETDVTRLEDLAHLLAATAEAIHEAVEASGRVARDLALVPRTRS